MAERAAKALMESIPHLRVVKTRDGYDGMANLEDVLEDIRSSQASLLIVAMGNPLQEKWLYRHMAKTGAKLGIGVGAFLDFAAGEVSRAPQILRTLKIEWTYRLAKEPKRMFKRYIVGNPLFVARAIKERLTGSV